MSVPNQRIIYIQRNSVNARKDFFKIGHQQLNKAANDLKGNTFKLYIYLANNRDNYILELSSKDFVQWSGTSHSTYDRAFEELKEKHYLIQPNNEHKNYYLFVEESDSYNDRHKADKIILEDEQKIKEIFNISGSK